MGISAFAYACSGGHGTNGFDGGGSGGGAGGGGAGVGGGSGDSGIFNGDGSSGGGPGDGGVTVMTTIYAHTDTTLYTMDPQSMHVTKVGDFTGLPSTDAGPPNVTDLAVNANGDVYVNTESDIYKAAVPSGPGPVPLTHFASISAGGTKKYFYALAFAPAGVLGSSETLVAGDGNGEIWSVDANGAAKDLGNFGADSTKSCLSSGQTGTCTYALSGDIVFYTENGAATGIATIRSCKTGTTTCTKNDFLAGIDVTALSTAYTTSTPAATLLKGIYGGSSTSPGPGTGHGDLFGLGAWGGEVYAFSRNYGSNPTSPPALLTIDTTTGAGTVITSSFNFTNGWSGAGVTTKTTVNIPPPPPPPR